MAEGFNKDMNIIAQSDVEIQIDPITKDMNIIQQLDDEPNDVGGLSAQALKAKFDEGGIAIKDYINNSLIPQVLSEGATEAQRQANEAQRQANEAQRKVNEAQRQEHEEAREVWENFDRNKTYVPGNKVYYSGSSYVNCHSCSGILPTDTYYWQMIAKKGDDGDSLADLDERYLKLSGGTVTGSLRVTGDSLTTGESGFNQQPGKSTPIYINGPSLADGLINPGPTSASIVADIYMSVGPYGEGAESDFLEVDGRSLLLRKNLFMDGQNIRHLGEPTRPDDAVNKQYVDNIVRNTVVSSSTVQISAADLQAYIDALPRLRTESLFIQVLAGHVPQTLTIENFYGPGTIMINGPGADSGIMDNGISITNCSNPIYVQNFDVRGSSVGNAITVSISGQISLANLSADGSHFPNSTTPFGLSAGRQSRVTAAACAFSGFHLVVYCEGSTVRISSCSGSANNIGIAVEAGGISLLSGTTPDLMGGATNGKWGGAIFDKNGNPI